MEEYESQQWLDELQKCFTGSDGTEPMKHWESILNNLGLFFFTHRRLDLTVLLWEFICEYGTMTQIAAFNLSSHYLQLTKQMTEKGITAKGPSPKLSQFPEEGNFHPDQLVNELMKRNDLLSKVS